MLNNGWTWWMWFIWGVMLFFQGNLLVLETPNILYRIGRKKYGHTAMGTAIEMHGDSKSIRACWKALKALDECRHAHFYGDECQLCFFINEGVNDE